MPNKCILSLAEHSETYFPGLTNDGDELRRKYHSGENIHMQLQNVTGKKEAKMLRETVTFSSNCSMVQNRL